MNKLSGPIALLKKGYELFINNKVIIWIALIPAIISALAQVIYIFGGSSIPTGIVGVIASIVSGILSILMVPAIINTIHRISTEQGVVLNVSTQYRYGFSLFLSVLLINIITSLAIIGGSVLFLVPGIIVAIFTAFSIFSLVIDGKKGFSAITDSYSLIKGRLGSVFGILFSIGFIISISWLILVGLTYLASLISGLPMYEMAEGFSEASPTLFGQIVNIVISLIGSAILVPISFGASYSLYTELKSTRLPDINVVPFKRWSIFFICLGVIVPILGIMLAITLISLNSANIMNKKAELDSTLQSMIIQQGLENTLEEMNIASSTQQ